MVQLQSSPNTKQTKTNTQTNTQTNIQTNSQAIYLTFIVDRSGSMMTCGNSVYEGIKSTIKNKRELAKKRNKKIYLTIYTFDDEINIIDIPQDPSKLTKEHYNRIKENIEPRGWTRLYDTIHEAANYTTTLQEKNNDIHSRGFMIIITDGEDNRSDISRKSLKKEIAYHQKTGMEYVFIGANINAKKIGTKIGISQDSCLQFTPNPRLTRATFQSINTSIERSINTDENPIFTQEERHAAYIQDIIRKPESVPKSFKYGQKIEDIGIDISAFKDIGDTSKIQNNISAEQWLKELNESFDIMNNDILFKLAETDSDSEEFDEYFGVDLGMDLDVECEPTMEDIVNKKIKNKHRFSRVHTFPIDDTPRSPLNIEEIMKIYK